MDSRDFPSTLEDESIKSEEGEPHHESYHEHEYLNEGTGFRSGSASARDVDAYGKMEQNTSSDPPARPQRPTSHSQDAEFVQDNGTEKARIIQALKEEYQASLQEEQMLMQSQMQMVSQLNKLKSYVARIESDTQLARLATEQAQVARLMHRTAQTDDGTSSDGGELARLLGSLAVDGSLVQPPNTEGDDDVGGALTVGDDDDVVTIEVRF